MPFIKAPVLRQYLKWWDLIIDVGYMRIVIIDVTYKFCSELRRQFGISNVLAVANCNSDKFLSGNNARIKLQKGLVWDWDGTGLELNQQAWRGLHIKLAPPPRCFVYTNARFP